MDKNEQEAFHVNIYCINYDTKCFGNCNSIHNQLARHKIPRSKIHPISGWLDYLQRQQADHNPDAARFASISASSKYSFYRFK